MNLGRTLYNYDLIPKIVVDPYWLLGFIEAEGCFSVYKPTNSSSKVASFDISQTDGELILLTIKKLLSLKPTVRVDSTGNYKLKITSVRCIENLIKFLNNSNIKLLGYKKLQYLIWLKELRTIDRYNKKFKVPNKY